MCVVQCAGAVCGVRSVGVACSVLCALCGVRCVVCGVLCGVRCVVCGVLCAMCRCGV